MPKIRKIVDPPKEKDSKAIHPNLPQPPASILMVMPCKSGKSTIGSNLILNDDFYGLDYFGLPPMVISPTINNCLTNRFLKKCCDVYDEYNDNIIYDFVKKQKTFGEVSNMPSACVFIDDCLGEKTTALDGLASRYRHSAIALLIFSTQSFRKGTSPTIRSNATNILVGKLQNENELDKVISEYSGMFGGETNFKKLYNEATKDKFSFLHLNLQENPAEAWVRFERKIYPTNNEIKEIDENISDED